MIQIEPKVSIIIPIYKVENYLAQCIDSVINQTLKEIEIILVDEGDMDVCRSIIDYYEQNDKRVIALHDKHGGYGASVNHGFDIAQGEYIGIVESDDFIEADMYEELYNYAKKLDADVVKAPFYNTYQESVKKNVYSKTEDFSGIFITNNVPNNILYDVTEYPMQFAFHPAIWSGLYRTEYIRRNNIRFVKNGAYVDCGFRFDTLLNTKKAAWFNKPFYNYRLDNQSSTANNWNTKTMLKRLAEVHETFDEKFGMDVYNKIGPYFIKEEYRTTLEKLLFYLAHDDEAGHYQFIHNSLQFTSNEIIEKSPILEPHEKVIILLAKNVMTYDNFLIELKKKHIYCFLLVPRTWRWIFRKVYVFFRCWEEHGLLYTLRRLFKKCIRKLQRVSQLAG